VPDLVRWSDFWLARLMQPWHSIDLMTTKPDDQGLDPANERFTRWRECKWLAKCPKCETEVVIEPFDETESATPKCVKCRRTMTVSTLSQYGMARQMGFNQSQVARFESQARTPSFAFAQAVVAVTGGEICPTCNNQHPCEHTK